MEVPRYAVAVVLVVLLFASVITESSLPNHTVGVRVAATPESGVGPTLGPVAPPRVVGFLSSDVGAGTLANRAPGNCSQGDNTIDVSPAAGNMQAVLLGDYDQLGQEGGGTLELGPGTYVLNQTLTLQKYSNVSIQGAGMGKTILSLPPDPVGTFTADNGTPLGSYNATLGGPVGGVTANFLQIAGPEPINNFEMCSLTVRAQANNASEDWDGSMIFDSSGGYHHSYSDIAEVGFFGPSTEPNGLHLESGAGGATGTDYVIDDLEASNNSVPFESYSDFKGGPNFLNVGAVVNSTVENVTGIGLAAFEVAPARGCLIENWAVVGHMLIDPATGGPWDGTLFQNVTVNMNGTAAPNALSVSLPGASGGSNFTGLRWDDDAFYGGVLHGGNMVDVENSTFYGGLNDTPAIFTGNTVVWTAPDAARLLLPILVQGDPTNESASTVYGNTFTFPDGTQGRDPFQLTVPLDVWAHDSIAISGLSTGYLFSAPDLVLSGASNFSFLTYRSLGDGSPAAQTLFDLAGSPGFVDLGASVEGLVQIYDDLPQEAPAAPTGLEARWSSANAVQLSWDPPAGPVTGYTVLVGTNNSSYPLSFSAGLNTTYTVENLQPAPGYFFAVEAWNSSRPSPASAPIYLAALSAPSPEIGFIVLGIAAAIGVTFAVLGYLRASRRAG